MSQTTPKSQQFKCSVCNTTLLNPNEFVAHTKTHQPPEQSCECGREIPCPGGTHPPGCLVLHFAKCPKHDSTPANIAVNKHRLDEDYTYTNRIIDLIPHANEIYHKTNTTRDEIIANADKVINDFIKTRITGFIHGINSQINNCVKQHKFQTVIGLTYLISSISLPQNPDEYLKLCQSANVILSRSVKGLDETNIAQGAENDCFANKLKLANLVFDDAKPLFEKKGYTISFNEIAAFPQQSTYIVKWG
jgi:hypothetical protein